MLVRRVFFGLAALSLAVLVFIAGYAAYPLLHQGSLPSVTPPGSDVAEGEAEMGKYWQVWDLLDRDFFGDEAGRGQTHRRRHRRYGADL